jgi:hypothetical protein
MAGIAIMINNAKLEKYHNIGMCPQCGGRAAPIFYYHHDIDQCVMCSRLLEWTGKRYIIADIGRQLELVVS